jgi:hypothetical protein
VPRDLELIVMKLLEKDPNDRFRSGSDLMAALDGGEFESETRQPKAMPTLEEGFHNMMGSVMKPAIPPFMKPFGMPSIFEPVPGFSARMEARAAKHRARMERHEEKERRRESKPLPDRIRSFRRHLASYFGTTTFLFGINAVTGGPDPFWWAFFPALGMMMGLVNEGGALWAAGARIRDVFSNASLARHPDAALGSGHASSPQKIDKDAEMIAEVLAGPRGDVARQAVSDRRAIKDLITRMSKPDRDMLPDVEGTSEALYQRIAELGRALHRLDGEIKSDHLLELDDRIAQSEKGQVSAEQERRVRLLKRQRETLAGLLESRDKLSEQYESAGLLLQNLKLDLIRMRSSGLQSGISNVNSATQEARALSKEISYVLAAAAELRDIDGKP